MSSYEESWFLTQAVRSVFTFLDNIAFSLLGYMYEIFFKVANAEIISGATINSFVTRLQLIVGVFMVFKLSITILQVIMDPDKMNDSKTKENVFSSIIMRVVVVLVMLTMLVPINIPNPETPYEEQLKSNGLMFGTLYSLQERILKGNTIGKLLLGTPSLSQGDTSESELQGQQLSSNTTQFVNAIAKAFVTINYKHNLGANENPNDSSLYMCEKDNTAMEDYKIYSSDNVSFATITDLAVNSKCHVDGKDRFSFYYIGVVGTIVSVIFIVILLGYSVDIAIRAAKLAVLRILAPISIISYLSPKQEQKGAFGNWVKLLTSTYLDLFFRLAIIYFVLSLIQGMIQNGVQLTLFGGGFVGIFATIILWIGLFFFAKMAPKFIKDVLGVEGLASNIGLGAILGGTAMAMGGGGLAGFGYGAMNGAKMQHDAAIAGKKAPLGDSWSKNSDLMAKIRTGDKDAEGGAFGRMRDYMNYQTRERNARRMGIGAYDVAEADYMAKQYKKMMEQAQSELEDAKILYQHDPTNPQNKAAYQKAAQKYGSYAEAFEKAKKRADSMDKARGQLGVGPRIIDTREFKPSLRQRIMGIDGTEGTYRSPIKAEGNYDISNMPDSIKPFELDKDIQNSIRSEKRDPNGFEGTIDDSTWTTSGHGTRTRP